MARMPGGKDPAFEGLSPAEALQLGRPRVLTGSGARGPRTSVYTVVPGSHWPRVRTLLLARGRSYVPGLQADLSAYTPGETIRLLDHPTVRIWHARMATFVLPRRVQ